MTTSSETSQTSERFNLSDAQKERVKLPPRVVLYGEPGIGKTTFGVSAKKPILIATEEGALGMECARLPTDGICQAYEDVLEAIKVLREQDHDFQTVVFDDLGGIERLCAEMICETQFNGVWNPVRGTEAYSSYAKGAKATAQEIRYLLQDVEALWREREMMVIFLAHAGLMKSGNALGEDFQKFAPAIDRYMWEVVCGWADMVGHAARDIHVSKEKGQKGKGRAVDAERYVYWEGSPGRDAKSRAGYEMPSRILLGYEDFAAALKSDPTEALAEQALDLLTFVPQEIVEKTAEFLKTKKKITAKDLRKIGKARLATLVNRLMARTPAADEESTEPAAAETKKKTTRKTGGSRKKKASAESSDSK